jgi:hypothetical protein
MAVKIKITCPKCKKPLWAPQQQQGKRVKCPGCQTILVVPAVKAVDMEALAAAALADRPAAEESSAAPVKPIDFHCPQCDEKIQAPADLAGKQMPCPECSRIVKVPLPARTEPKDWRKVDTRAAAAALKRDAEPAPEGAWGTASSSRVSTAALEVAEVIPMAVERLTWGQRTRWGLIVASAVVAGFLTVWGAWQFARLKSQQRQVARVLELVEKGETPLPDIQAAEIFRATGEYDIGAGKAQAAARNLTESASRLERVPSTAAERDALLLELGLTEIDLGGDETDVIAAKRLRWEDLSKDMIRIVERLTSPDARVIAVRDLCGKLGRKGQSVLAMTLAQTVPVGFVGKDRPEMLALAALALSNAGQVESAKTVAASLLKPFEARLKDEKIKGQLPGSYLLALLIGVGMADKAQILTKATLADGLKDPYPEVRLGFAQGLASQEKWNEARQQAATPGSAPLRLEALVAVAAIARAKDHPDEAEKAIQAALEVAKTLLPTEEWKALSPWLLYRLVQIGSWAGLFDKLEFVAEAIPNDDLRERAKLEILRGQLHAQGKDASPLSEQPTSPPLFLELLARHAGRYRGAGAAKVIDRWEPPALRPFGYIGLVLGEQDRLLDRSQN